MPPLTREALRWFGPEYLPSADIGLRDWRFSPLQADSLARPAHPVLAAGFGPLRHGGKVYGIAFALLMRMPTLRIFPIKFIVLSNLMVY
jgi:hypothetical protein